MVVFCGLVVVQRELLLPDVIPTPQKNKRLAAKFINN
jgi:hypothetical protein